MPAGLETSAAPPLYVQVQLFKSGEHGYHTYRIPALAASKKGRLLAFVEGRKSGRSDTGDIDVLLRRSFDNGKTWTEAQVVADHGDDTIGNPCPVVDAGTRTIWLLLTGNPGKTNETQILDDAGQGTRTVWVTHSNDDGATWAAPIEITSSVKEKNWTWYATGPGNGIQLESGRLLVPCDHARQGSHKIYSHVIYSDDHGRTWRIGGTVGEDTDECQVVELQDGTLLVNMRSNHGKNRRALSRSRDGGLSWSPIEFDETLIEPVCQASFIRYTRKGKSATRSRLLFSNPAGVKRV
ncbi:MAG: exo-alpha-sialidase, partial [Acidobacteria bacterium]